MNSIMQNPDLDDFINKFYGAFDNRFGRIPTREQIADLFLKNATIITSKGENTTILTIDEFVEPRIALLTSGRLRDFYEWELKSTTQYYGEFAIRSSEYEKWGTMDSAVYKGRGIKLFQLVYIDCQWKIASLCWRDHNAEEPAAKDVRTQPYKPRSRFGK